jgi:hypothetical protein
MRRITLGLLAATAVTAAALPAAASTTISFDERTSADGVNTGDFESDGFAFSNIQDAGFRSWGTEGEFSPFNADPDGATLFNNANGPGTFTKVGGGAFALTSIDIAGNTDGKEFGGAPIVDPSPFVVRFTGALAGGGTVTQDFTLSGGVGLSNFMFDSDFLDVRSVSWDAGPAGGEGHFAQLDNIIAGDAVTGGVPEPAAWALMLAGFAGVGGLLRRRRAEMFASAA